MCASKVAYQSSQSSLSAGACGYGPFALSFNDGHVAAAVPSLYKDGAGCGACFQIRCKDTKLCSGKGTVVKVTDLNKNTESDFVLSNTAFTAMAKDNMGQDLLKLGIVDVEYKRVPCTFPNPQNLSVKVEDSSHQYYLSIMLLFQGGQTEVIAVDVAQAGSAQWSIMTRTYGAIWSTSEVPTGPWQFRFSVKSGNDPKTVVAPIVVPADYKKGVIYDTGVQINAIMPENCSPCETGDWN